MLRAGKHALLSHTYYCSERCTPLTAHLICHCYYL